MYLDDRTFQTLAANLKPTNGSTSKFASLQCWLNGYDLTVNDEQITCDYEGKTGWWKVHLTEDQIVHLRELLEAEREEQRFYETSERIPPYYWRDDLTRI